LQKTASAEEILEEENEKDLYEPYIIDPDDEVFVLLEDDEDIENAVMESSLF